MNELNLTKYLSKWGIVNYKAFNQVSFDTFSSKIGHSVVTFWGLEYDRLSSPFVLRTGKSQDLIFQEWL